MTKEDEKPVASSSEEEDDEESGEEESGDEESSESESNGYVAPDSVPEVVEPKTLPPTKILSSPTHTTSCKKPTDDNPAAVVKSQPPLPPSSSKTQSSDEDGEDSESEQNVTVQLPKAKSGNTNKKRNNSEADKSEADTAKESQPNKKLFAKIFSDHEEIIVLQGMLQVDNPATGNLHAVYENIKNKHLHFEKTYKQFAEKTRRLKEKYLKNQKKGGPNMGDLHETELYKLSNEIWGNLIEPSVVGNVSTVMRYAGVNKANDVELQHNQFSGLEPPPPSYFLGLTTEEEKRMLKKGSALFEGGTLVEGADEWKNLELEEMEFYQMKLDVVDAYNELQRKRVKLVVNGIKSCRRINKEA